MKVILFAFLAVLSGCLSLQEAAYDEIKTGMYRDGGTVWVELNEDGRIERLCIDRQIRSKTRFEMFIGARHPTDEGATILSGKARMKWVELLQQALAKDSGEHARFIEVLNEHIKYKQAELNGVRERLSDE